MSRLLALVCALALALAGCGGDDPGPGPEAGGSSSPQEVRSADQPIEPSRTPPPTSSPTPEPTRVLAISVDGLNPEAILRLGAAGTPAIHRLLAEGAGTLDARTEVEQTVTLPNHTSMVTGRRIDAAQDGHGVTWNENLDRSIPEVASVFTVVHAAGGSTAVFAGKEKFSLFDRSWPEAVDGSLILPEPQALTEAVIGDLTTEDRDFTFLHLAGPDTTGHVAGFMSDAYLEAVRHTDELIARVMGTAKALGVTVILTADHGGEGPTHGAAGDPDNFTIPFVVWGPGIGHGDLYALNADDYRDPGDAQPSYDGAQPVRNGDVANLALDLLGLGPVPGSQLNAAQDLTVTTNP